MAGNTKKQLSSQEKQKKYMLMALSLLLSIGLWIYASSTDNRDAVKSFDVPVEILNETALDSAGLVMTDIEGAQVTVEIQGRRSAVSSVKASDIVATIDVSGYGEGEHYADVTVHVPSTVTVAEVTPAQVRFTIEQRVTEDRDVSVKFTGNVPSDEEAVCLERSTEIVSVSGASSAVSRVTGLEAVIDSSKLTYNEKTFITTLVPVDSVGTEVENVTASISSISVTACLYKVKSVDLEVTTVGQLQGNLELSSIDAPKKVTLAGPEDELDEITSVSTDAVDLSTISATTEVELKPDIPGNVRLAASQKSVKAVITVRKVSVKVFSFTEDDIELTGVPSGRTAVLKDKSVSIEVKGTDTALDSLSSADFTLSVDCSALSSSGGMAAVNVTMSDKAEEADVTVSNAEVEVEFE